MTAVTTERSLVAELTNFIKTTMEVEETTSMERLIWAAQQNFEGDDWMREALIREGLTSLIPGLAQEVRHKLRQKARYSTNDETRRERMASVFEHVGFGFSKSLLSMTRPDHLFAAQERERQAAGHLRWAGFHRSVAELHKNDTTPTSALSKTKISQLWQQHIERSD